MVKSQPERVFIVTNIIAPNGTKKSFPATEISSDGPPKIPPRMKKKGPALPEKPPHMRASPPSKPTTPSHQPPRDPLRPRSMPSNFDNRQPEREVLVAASRGAARERPVEKRQREPAKLLMPTSGAPPRKDLVTLEDRLSFPTKKSDIRPDTTMMRKQRPPQPILLIPRGMVSPWGSNPVSYALWMQREASTPPSMKVALSRREPVKPILDSGQVHSSKVRSGSVTRSGSLTSQGSSSSDSGNETFPKSVLKKQKRQTPNNTAKGNGNSKKMEHKKNVTFNAFATVQLMEE